MDNVYELLEYVIRQRFGMVNCAYLVRVLTLSIYKSPETVRNDHGRSWVMDWSKRIVSERDVLFSRPTKVVGG